MRDIGATYHTGSVLDIGFEPDIIVECMGVGSVIAEAIQKIGAGGIAPRAIADMATAAVLKNNAIVGSVNANKRHWYRANERLNRLDKKWLSRLITRYEKPENFEQALERKPDDIKVVIQFSDI